MDREYIIDGIIEMLSDLEGSESISRLQYEQMEDWELEEVENHLVSILCEE